MFSTLALLTTIGCGPPRLGSSQSEGDTDSGEVDSDSDSMSESETSASTTGMETSDDDATTNGFIVPFDDLGMVAECDEFLQDCPEGEKCVPYSRSGGLWDGNKCVAVTGDGKPGEACSWQGAVEATDDCDATSMCWDVKEVDGAWIGTCHEFCTGTPDTPECPMDTSCVVDSNGHINICVFDCDPLLQDCSPDRGCYWVGSRFNCAFTTQNLPTGEPCGFVNDCAPGHLCAGAEALPSCAGSTCCTPFCDLEIGDEHCQTMPGTSCVPMFEEGTAPPGYEVVGVCALPP